MKKLKILFVFLTFFVFKNVSVNAQLDESPATKLNQIHTKFMILDSAESVMRNRPNSRMKECILIVIDEYRSGIVNKNEFEIIFLNDKTQPAAFTDCEPIKNDHYIMHINNAFTGNISANSQVVLSTVQAISNLILNKSAIMKGENPCTGTIPEEVLVKLNSN